VQPRHEVSDGGEHDVGLAERRQDAADVVEEGRVRAHHQHAVTFHLFTMGVKQVRDAVQRHHGLTGTRSTFDDQNALMVEADDLVLLGLNRRHDVAHPVTARCVDRREQRGIAALRPVRSAEDLVGELDDVAPPGEELASAPHAFGVRGGGDVEGTRRGRPPVEQQRFVFVGFVEDSDTPDVQLLVVGAVQSTEAQAMVSHVQSLHLFGDRAHLDIPVDERPAVLFVDRAAQRRAVPALHPRAFGVQPVVQSGHIVALG
jgi:hypothetical protein